MRCDRVEFDLGAEALPHRHKGGGIRCLVHGTLELCSILPREIRGQSSIMYVDPSDAGSKPRKYTVLVDEPIELPR